MKQFKTLYVLLLALLVFSACNDGETYSDQKKKEASAIQSFIAKHGIKVISADAFRAAGNKTDVSKNEYVLFEDNGVYMQIVSQGTGKAIAPGEVTRLLIRFDEKNVFTDSLSLTNNILAYANYYDAMTVSNNSGTFTAAFDKSGSVLATAYNSGSTAVPQGWLVPLPYIKPVRPANDGDELPRVRLIVPHAYGHLVSTSTVTPYYYELTYQRGRN